MLSPRIWLSTLTAAGIVGSVLVLPVATPAVAKPRPVSPVVEQVSLTASGASSLAADSGSVPTVTHEAEQPFRLVGITWSGREPVGSEFEVRTRVGGEWGEWVELHQSDDSPDANSEEGQQVTRGGTEPLLAPDSDAVQVRVVAGGQALPKDLRVELIDPGSSPADGAITPTPVSSAQAAATTPAFVSRAQWGADESLRSGSPKYMSTIRAGFVHHTASSNSYWQKSGWTQADAAKDIRAIYAYSVNSRGYSDIPYNFLVDQAGRIYEGRAGGVDKAVQSGATGGFNTDTFAIAALGNLDTASPTSGLVQGISRVAAWKLDLFHRDPTGSVTLTSSGGGTSKYSAGQKATIPVLAAHRDVGSTACPGRYLFSQLSAIRSAARSLIGAALFNPSFDSGSGVLGSAVARIRATSSIPQSWQLRVEDFCAGATVRTWSGDAGAGSWLIPWDGKTDSGASAGIGRFRLTLTASGSGSTSRPLQYYYTVLKSAGASLACPNASRSGGSDRWATAVALGREAAPSAKTVVLVSGEQRNLVDGLVVAPLAKKLGAPVLLSANDKLPPAVRSELLSRGATKVYVVGALQATVLNEVRALGAAVTQISGADRFATAGLVAEALAPTGTAAVVASGEDASLVDALSAAGPAAASGRPILLTRKNEVPAATKQALTALGTTATSVIGSTGVISETVRTQLPKAARLGGADRYATAVAVANGFSFATAPDLAVVASGMTANLADALAAGALGRSVVLVTPTALPSATQQWLDDRARSLTIAGGPAAVSDSVLILSARSAR